MRSASRAAKAGSVFAHLGVMGAVAVLMGLLTAGLVIPFAAVGGVTARNVAASMDKLAVTGRSPGGHRAARWPICSS